MKAPSPREAVADLAETLRSLGLVGRPAGSNDLMVEVSGGHVHLKVKTAGTPTPASVAAMVRELPKDSGNPLLVANRLFPGVRTMLNDGSWSWLDRSGHLRLWADGLRIDTPIPPLLPSDLAAPPQPLSTPVGREVAVLLLIAPSGVRTMATQLGRSPSSVSVALRALRHAGLVDDAGRALVPDLFWEVAGEWGRDQRSVPLLGSPGPGDARRTRQLALGLTDPEETTGWALRGPVAAAAWGATAPVRGDYPPDFFVPDDRTLRIAVQLYGRAPSADARQSTVTVTPMDWVVTHRVDLAARGIANTEWPAVHPVIAALDLASEGQRGQETLEAWQLPAGWTRVW